MFIHKTYLTIKKKKILTIQTQQGELRSYFAIKRRTLWAKSAGLFFSSSEGEYMGRYWEKEIEKPVSSFLHKGDMSVQIQVKWGLGSQTQPKHVHDTLHFQRDSSSRERERVNEVASLP